MVSKCGPSGSKSPSTNIHHTGQRVSMLPGLCTNRGTGSSGFGVLEWPRNGCCCGVGGTEFDDLWSWAYQDCVCGKLGTGEDVEFVWKDIEMDGESVPGSVERIGGCGFDEEGEEELEGCGGVCWTCSHVRTIHSKERVVVTGEKFDQKLLIHSTRSYVHLRAESIQH